MLSWANLPKKESRTGLYCSGAKTSMATWIA